MIAYLMFTNKTADQATLNKYFRIVFGVPNLYDV